MSRLPDFLIAGAPRCGSTSLYRMLDHHPAVFMARPKEIGFFNGRRGGDLEWYSEHFAGAPQGHIAGEATPWYLHDSVAIDNMAEIVPGARIVVILRDPVDRAYSHYWMARNRGRADVPFEEFVDSTSALAIGRYVDHLRYLAEHFPRDQILVVFNQELRHDPQNMYSRVCEFIGVDGSHMADTTGKTVNQYVEFRSRKLRTLTKAMPSSLAVPRRVIGRLNTRRSAKYPPMNPETKERLAAFYEQPTADLASWLGRDLPSWTQPQMPS